jgi:hypothetical protein
MKQKTVFFIFIAIVASSIFASPLWAQTEIPQFSDGSKVKCLATHVVGNDGKGYTAQPMDVFYRLDSGLYEIAYFRKVVKLGNYSYDGFCSKDTCDLSIRDLRTNTVSAMNATFAKINNNTAQIQIMNFGENLTLGLSCTLYK